MGDSETVLGIHMVQDTCIETFLKSESPSNNLFLVTSLVTYITLIETGDYSVNIEYIEIISM